MAVIYFKHLGLYVSMVTGYILITMHNELKVPTRQTLIGRDWSRNGTSLRPLRQYRTELSRCLSIYSLLVQSTLHFDQYGYQT